MDTTPLVVEPDSHVCDSITLSTGEVSLPLTTSTPQKECGATCLHEDNNTTSGDVEESNGDATAEVKTQIVTELDEDNPSSSKTSLKLSPSKDNVSENRKCAFKSIALLRILGYCPELDELDKLRTADDAGLNEYIILKHFVQRYSKK